MTPFLPVKALSSGLPGTVPSPEGQGVEPDIPSGGVEDGEWIKNLNYPKR